jgi:hypothetical protein
MITISNQNLTIKIDESLGGEIQQIEFDGDPLLAFDDWHAPVKSSRSRTYGDEKLDWLSEYRGGWQLLVPNAGAACVIDNLPLPFHGEWSRTKVDIVHTSPSEVSMQAGTRLPFVVRRTIRVCNDPARVQITTTVTNIAESPYPFVWGEHPAFLASPGDQIDMPPGDVLDAADELHRTTTWPDGPLGDSRLDRVPSVRPTESVHFLPDRSSGWVALRRAHVGVALVWDIIDFPHLWLWRELGSTGFPFFGRTSIVALEPACTWPGDGLANAVDRGQAHFLNGGESRTATVTLIPFRPDGRAVVGADQQGTVRFEDDRHQ